MNKTLELAVIAIVVVAVVAAAGYFTFKTFSPVTLEQPEVEGTKTEQGTVAVTGASPISETGQVVTTEGKPVRLDVAPGSPEAPQESAPITSPSQIPSKAVKISVSNAGFSPDGFTVDAGQPVTIAITSEDLKTHIFMFDDPSLSAVAVGVGPGDPTRVISFNAPKAGEYPFHDDMPGRQNAKGKMIVQ